MRIELEVDLRSAGPGLAATEKSAVDPEIRAEKLLRDREERRLRRLALGRVIEARIASGYFADLAAVARRCGASKARISHVVCPPEPQ